jgi:hypothetical protein
MRFDIARLFPFMLSLPGLSYDEGSKHSESVFSSLAERRCPKAPKSNLTRVPYVERRHAADLDLACHRSRSRGRTSLP